MRWTLGFVVATALAAWWILRPHATPVAGNEALTERVLRDLAAYHHGELWWDIRNGQGSLFGDGVWVRSTQTRPASIEVEHGWVQLQTPTWRVIVELDKVHEIVCRRDFIHEPPPGFLMLFVEFRKGPDDEDGYPDELFEVMFPQEQEAYFIALCKRYGLRRIGF